MRQDSMYNVSPEVTMLQLQIAVWGQAQYGQVTKNALLPRLLWVKKE